MSILSRQDSRLQHAKATAVRVYAPTKVSTDDQKKNDLYETLQSVLDNITNYDIRLVIGDFKAKIGPGRQGVKSAVGLFGSSSNTNSNGEK